MSENTPKTQASPYRVKVNELGAALRKVEQAKATIERAQLALLNAEEEVLKIEAELDQLRQH